MRQGLSFPALVQKGQSLVFDGLAWSLSYVLTSAATLTSTRIPVAGVSGVLKDSQLSDGVTGSVLTIAGTLTAPRTLTLPDAAVTIPTGTLLTGTLANANRLDSTSSAGVVKESQIADAVTGNVLTIAGTLTGLRTQTARDASGNLCLDSVNNTFTVTQQFNAAEAVALGVAATAGNGLIQLASGTTKANGIAYGDTYQFRSASGSISQTGPAATDIIYNISRSTGETFFMSAQSTAAIFGTSSNTQFILRTNSFNAITIDTSQNVTAQVALTSLHPTAGVGYSAGAGGTVTQITSRTTGVTLNKITGAITLASAAGSAAWQSFTVTNSAAAATDTIICNQVSGTDLNMIFVTAIAAGSFRISFATTAGVTVEQPVFRFTVLKSVSA